MDTLDDGTARKSQLWFILGTVLVTLSIAYGASRWEVVSRAREAFQQGEKYELWMAQPGQKKSSLDAELAAGRISAEDHERLMEDSDLKNAVIWYETAVDLFQPPRSQWVLKAEARLKELKPKERAWQKSLGLDIVDDAPHPDTRLHW